MSSLTISGSQGTVTGGYLSNAGASFLIDNTGEMTAAPASGHKLTITGNGLVTSGLAVAFASKTAAYTITASDAVVVCDGTSAAFTVTLPAANGVSAGKQYVVKKIDSSSHAITVAAAGTDTIDGLATQVISSQWNSMTLIGDGSSHWYLI